VDGERKEREKIAAKEGIVYTSNEYVRYIA
jgi:hypothetical protein